MLEMSTLFCVTVVALSLAVLKKGSLRGVLPRHRKQKKTSLNGVKNPWFLRKIQGVGASTSALKWFNSYLTNRYQVVRIHSSVSDPLPVECGVPQGSILGPLSFSIYVNDLPEVPRHCSTERYVDDTKLFVSFNLHDSQRIVQEMNEDFLQVRNWCFGNRLLLNPDKTKLIVFGSR